MDSAINDFLGNSKELIILVRLVLSIILGFAIGFERELNKRPAGLRTHILVCSASCLVMLVSIYGFESGDPARFAAQAVSGIGFLGAGVILREDRGVIGITTAATIWMSAAIGLACGNGFYFGSIVVTFVALGSLILLRGIENKINLKKKDNFKIVIRTDKESINDNICSVADDLKMVMMSIESKKAELDGKFVNEIVMHFRREYTMRDICSFIDALSKKVNVIDSKIIDL